MSLENRVLVQYGKWPCLGKVKTRLAKAIGDEAALKAHITLLQAVNHEARSVSGCRYILSWGLANDRVSDSEQFYQSLRFDDDEYQIEGSLGAKMLHTFYSHLGLAKSPSGGDSDITHDQSTFNTGVVIIGSDCPSLDPSYIESAFSALNDNDLVLGPAEDGGYILIGARKMDSKLFEQVEWGGPKVLSKTIENAESLCYSVSQLDARWDVDNLSDWTRYCATLNS